MEKAGALSQQECWGLLAVGSVGRLALSINALPAILPVQYTSDGASISICLGQHEVPATSVHESVVAFGADEIDEGSRSGWAVQVQGIMHGPQEGNRVPWDCGQPPAGRVVHLEPVVMSGHRFDLCPFITGF